MSIHNMFLWRAVRNYHLIINKYPPYLLHCLPPWVMSKLFSMSHIVRKPVYAYANNKGADQPAHPRSLISTFVVRCLV